MITPQQFIEEHKLNYNLGKVIELVIKANKERNPLTTLNTAAYYLGREVTTITEKKKQKDFPTNSAFTNVTQTAKENEIQNINTKDSQ